MPNSITKGIKEYYKDLDELNSTKKLLKESEGDTDRIFANLLGKIAKEHHYFIRSKSAYKTESGTSIEFDTAVYTGVGIIYGVHEAKKKEVTLEKAIQEKREKGYPFFNIIFENSKEAILYQDNKSYNDVIDLTNKKAFTELLENFFSYTSPQIQKYNQSQKAFFEKIPEMIKKIRKQLDKAREDSKYIENILKFENLLKETINPTITRFETREIIVQHFLTIDIFNSVFREIRFEHHNPIAEELDKITKNIINKGIEAHILNSFSEYLKVVQREAANIDDFGIKKQFLLNFYEQFYKAYNPKGADRLGVVYTPEPVVQFMIRSTDHLLQKHFGKNLSDENINIIDPATGTGTFIYYLLEYLFKQKNAKTHKEKIKKKYKEEIFCNEVSILPYYIASLCIEKIYHEHTEEYDLFEGIVYQDTLDDVDYKDHPYEHTNVPQKKNLFKDVSQENLERKERQSQSKMTVIIGNPPYNANQQNENENNKNREYPIIDERVKETYISKSTAQKTKVYDMYARFIRWASDRIQESGIIAFVTNNSFIDSRSYDGFRKVVAKEFDFIYVVDCKGDLNRDKADPKHRIFYDRCKSGIGITFFVKEKHKTNQEALIKYISPFSLDDLGEEKLDYLQKKNIKDILFDKIIPNKRGYWLNTVNSDFEEFIPVISKNKKDKTIFTKSSLGVATNRDLWVYDHDEHLLSEKVKYFIHTYNELLKKHVGKDKAFEDIRMKWSSTLHNHFKSINELESYTKGKNIISLYRPFSKRYYYAEKILSDRLTENHYKIFGKNLDKENICIHFSGISSSRKFQVLTSKLFVSLDFLEKTNALPLYTYKNNQREDNITKWALEQFQDYYSDQKIMKKDIFHYIYAVLNHEAYIQKYAVELSRDYPRIPFYKPFKELATLGEVLMHIHLNFETLDPLEGVKVLHKTKEKTGMIPKLKVLKKEGVVLIDNQTSIEGIPPKAFEYKLGQRSPIEWALDQHKPLSTSSSQKANYGVIFERFNTPVNEQKRFKKISRPLLIDLIPRLANLSLKTLDIKESIRNAVDGPIDPLKTHELTMVSKL